MRDIEGIEEALEVLKPHWSEIEEDFNRYNNRYLELASKDYQPIGRVLRAHLIIENFMNSHLVNLFKIEDIEDLRLTFSQKAKMLPQSQTSAAWVRPGIIQLNSVRNKFGHQIEYDVDFTAINSISSILEVSRPGIRFETPVDAIEAFVPVACAFLSAPSAHLSEVFSRAFRYVHTSTPKENERVPRRRR